MKSQAEVLASLLLIKEKINQKIPQPSNRYADLECVPVGTDLDHAVEDLKRHHQVILTKHMEYEVCLRLGAMLPQGETTSCTQLSPDAWLRLEKEMLSESDKLCAKIARMLACLKYDAIPVDEIEATIKNQISRLRDGETMVIDSGLAARFEADKQVAGHRSICDQQFAIPRYLISDIEAKDQLETAEKILCFWRGVYFSKPYINVGYCDEHACLALKELFDQNLIGEEDVLEKVSVQYGGNVGHVFLILNRDPESSLNDVNTWGSNAIIIDLWNRLVCLASEYESLPDRYPLLHKNGQWSSLAFSDSDYDLKNNLSELDTYWAMTGNESPDVRLPRIMQEYQLTSLESPEFRDIKTFLTDLSATVMPDNFGLHPEFFVTTSSNELIRVINGFSEPKIAVHKALLSTDAWHFDEIRFAMAHTLLQIKYHGVASSGEISAEAQHYLDKLALKKCQNAQAAIDYLRKSERFATENNQESTVLVTLSPTFKIRRITKATYEQRIKNMMTLLAEDESLRINRVSDAVIPESIAPILQSINEQDFFRVSVMADQTSSERIRYATSCLPELTTELHPYELTKEPEVRVRHFCRLLEQIQINLDDPDQLAATHDLISQAFHLRVPGFDLIYYTICRVEPDALSMPGLPALGVFHDLQVAINRFVHAENGHEIETEADVIETLLQQLKHHFKYIRYAYDRLDKHEKLHPQSIPPRLFTSSLGIQINWRSFEETNQESLPWERYVDQISATNNAAIARVLWWLGVTNDKRIWPAMGTHTLFKIAQKTPLIQLPGRLAHYSHRRGFSQPFYPELILEHESGRHVLITDMFDESLSFQTALKRFVSANIPALAAPGLLRRQNINNPAIHWLLSLFADVALGECDEDKQVVKDFFLSKTSQPGLHELLTIPKAVFTQLYYQLPFTQFVLHQQWNDRPFRLFTREEIISFIKSHYFASEIPDETYARIYGLSFDPDSLSSVIELVNHLKADNLISSISPIVRRHLERRRYNVFSHETAQILGTSFRNFFYGDRKLILNRFIWNLPATDAEQTTLDGSELSVIYRVYDTTRCFPNRTQQTALGNLIIRTIQRTNDPQSRMAILEDLLYSGNKSFSPHGDYQFKQEIIRQFVETVFEMHGKDTDDEPYYNAIIPIIDRVFRDAHQQDKYAILSRLAERIESQNRVSEHMGILFEPAQYMLMMGPEQANSTLGNLAIICSLFSENVPDQHCFLEFISSPLTDESIETFSHYLYYNHKSTEFLKALESHSRIEEPGPHGQEQEHLNTIRYYAQSFYHEFWGLSITKRAVIMEYLLLPPKSTLSDASSETAWQQAFAYVSGRLLPQADFDNDEQFALAILASYLEAADSYLRSYLLSGMLVASNTAQHASQPSGVGKKLVIICEQMGPAYIKLAQAIHSHPDTPQAIRRDLDHIKGHANPPDRWQLWRLINDVVPAHERQQIRRVGALLGSASYNLALKVTVNGPNGVLLLRRENAMKEARRGFDHLRTTFQNCEHPRMVAMRDSALSMLAEAERLSHVEMDSQASEEQYRLAAQLYHERRVVRVNDVDFDIEMRPVTLLNHGEGYRFLSRAYGVEYNDFPRSSPGTILIGKAIAKAVMRKELSNLLAGNPFDSDRHGNQVRVLVNPLTRRILLGLYDFGELSLHGANEMELQQLAGLIRDLPGTLFKGLFISERADDLLSMHMNQAMAAGQPATYLMRIRKAFLALRDFQNELSTMELLDIVKDIYHTQTSHPIIQSALTDGMSFIYAAEIAYKAVSAFRAPLQFFAPVSRSVDSFRDVPAKARATLSERV